MSEWDQAVHDLLDRLGRQPDRNLDTFAVVVLCRHQTM